MEQDLPDTTDQVEAIDQATQLGALTADQDGGVPAPSPKDDQGTDALIAKGISEMSRYHPDQIYLYPIQCLLCKALSILGHY